MYLYIVGRGHSGSTILDILLGNSSEIESVGELLSGLSRADQEVCSCGAAMSKCPFWREIRARVEAEGIAWDDVGRIRGTGAVALWRVWRANRSDPAMARRAEITRALARAITGYTGKPHLAESSKTPTHGLLLLRYLPEARLIHLVRDPRYVARSHLWRMRKGEHLSRHRYPVVGLASVLSLLRVAARWTLVNLACDLMARAYPGRVVRIRFEDLCARPADELDRIGWAFGLDLTGAGRKIARRDELCVGHNIGGNHLRYKGGVRFDRGGGRPRPPLPCWLEIANLVLCGPLMWRYGYAFRSGAPPAPSTEALAGGSPSLRHCRGSKRALLRVIAPD